MEGSQCISGRGGHRGQGWKPVSLQSAQKGRGYPSTTLGLRLEETMLSHQSPKKGSWAKKGTTSKSWSIGSITPQKQDTDDSQGLPSKKGNGQPSQRPLPAGTEVYLQTLRCPIQHLGGRGRDSQGRHDTSSCAMKNFLSSPELNLRAPSSDPGAHGLYPPHAWSPEKEEIPGSLSCARREAKTVTSHKLTTLTPTLG